MSSSETSSKRRRVLVSAIVFILLAVSAVSLFVIWNNSMDQDDDEGVPDPGKADTNLAARLWFPVGETLKYKMFWGKLLVGRFTLSSSWREYEGKTVLAITGAAKTKSAVAKLYPVDDWVEVLVNPVTFLPLLYTQKLSEGSHQRHDVVTFDHAAGIARHTDPATGSNTVIQIQHDTRDVLSLVYFMRETKFDEAQQAKIKVLVDDQIYNLELAAHGNDTVESERFGEIDCLKVEPKASFGGLFVRKGRVYLWFSNDKRRICTKMKATVGALKFSAKLSRVLGPESEAWPTSR